MLTIYLKQYPLLTKNISVVGLRLMLNSVAFSSRLSILLSVKYFVPKSHALESGNKLNYYTQMTLNVYRCFSKSLKFCRSHMVEYLSKVHGLLHDFNELLPPISTPA